MDHSSRKAIALLVSASLIFGIVPALIKLVNTELSAAEIMFFRSLIPFILIALFLLLRPHYFKVNNWPLVAFRGLIGSIAVFLYIIALNYTKAGMATLLNNTYPIFTVILAYPVLGEKVEKRVLAPLLIAIYGIYLLFHPSLTQLNLGLALALISGIFSAFAIMSIRKLRENENPLMIFTSFVLFGFLLPAPFMLDNFIWPGPNAWLILLGIGLATLAGQLPMTYAYKFIKASEGSIASISTTVFSTLFAFLILNETLSAQEWFGMLLVIVAVLLLFYKPEKKGA